MKPQKVLLRGHGWNYETDWGNAVSDCEAKTLMEAVLTEFHSDERVPSSVFWIPQTCEVLGYYGDVYDLEAIEQARNDAYAAVYERAISGELEY